MNILCLDKLHLAGLTNAVKKQLVTMTTFLDEKTRGNFVFNQSAHLFTFVFLANHIILANRLKSRLTQNLHVVVEVT